MVATNSDVSSSNCSLYAHTQTSFMAFSLCEVAAETKFLTSWRGAPGNCTLISGVMVQLSAPGIISMAMMRAHTTRVKTAATFSLSGFWTDDKRRHQWPPRQTTPPPLASGWRTAPLRGGDKSWQTDRSPQQVRVQDGEQPG
ncbi:uncharacterized protein LOC144195534 isoform X1 [Stigmatopora nigra]